MHKRFFGPDLVSLTGAFILAFLIYFLVLVLVCFGQECVDGTCDKANAPQQSQVRFAPAGTVESQKNPAVARMEHDDHKGRGYFTGFFIVAPNELRMNILITAAHCFDGPGETRVYLPDGRTFKGEILTLDRIWDVAVVRVEGTNIPAMRLATEPPVRGDSISAYGYGWVGKQYSRINGVAIGYSIFKGQRVANTLKCSFAVRDGDSGGPMVNSRCEVVAVISCSDDQSGTHGTWAARIKVIMDRAIARKIKQISFVNEKEDTGKSSPPLITRRVSPPVVEAGTTGNETTIVKQPLIEVQHIAMPPPAPVLSDISGFIGTLGAALSEAATPSALSMGLQIATAVAGVGLTGGAGWGGWVVLKALFAIYRRRKGKSVAPSADNFSTLPRKAKEARQLLQLSELEGRSPLFDALIGRLALDELDDTIDGDRPEKDYAIRLKERLMRRFNEIAPVSVEKGEEK